MRIMPHALLVSLVVATLPFSAASASSSKKTPNFRIQETSAADFPANECYLSYFHEVFQGLALDDVGQVLDAENAKLLKVLYAMEPELSIVAKIEGATKPTDKNAPPSKIQTSFYLVNQSGSEMKLTSTPIVELNDQKCQVEAVTPAVRTAAHQTIKALYSAGVIRASRAATAGLSGMSEEAKSNRSLTSSILKTLDNAAR